MGACHKFVKMGVGGEWREASTCQRCVNGTRVLNFSSSVAVFLPSFSARPSVTILGSDHRPGATSNTVPPYDSVLPPKTKELYFVLDPTEAHLYQLIELRRGRRPFACGLVASLRLPSGCPGLTLGLPPVTVHVRFTGVVIRYPVP